jgi:hypothetical protein
MTLSNDANVWEFAEAIGSMQSVNRSASEWVGDFSRQLGLEAPDDDETASILALAGLAAHSSERTAAPITCWLAAKAGLSVDEAMMVAQRLVTHDTETE